MPPIIAFAVSGAPATVRVSAVAAWTGRHSSGTAGFALPSAPMPLTCLTWLARFGHGKKQRRERNTRCGCGAEGQKSSRIAEMVHNDAGCKSAQGRPNALNGCDGTLREIVATGAPHQISDHQRRDGAKNTGTNAVEQLQPRSAKPRYRRTCRARRRTGNTAKPIKRMGLRPIRSAVCPTTSATGSMIKLRGNDARRHHGRRQGWVRRRKLLPDERQQRRIPKVEEHRTDREYDERFASKQSGVTRGGLFVTLKCRSVLQAARTILVDRCVRDR